MTHQRISLPQWRQSPAATSAPKPREKFGAETKEFANMWIQRPAEAANRSMPCSSIIFMNLRKVVETKPSTSASFVRLTIGIADQSSEGRKLTELGIPGVNVTLIPFSAQKLPRFHHFLQPRFASINSTAFSRAISSGLISLGKEALTLPHLI